MTVRRWIRATLAEEPANQRTYGHCPAWESSSLLGCSRQPDHHGRAHMYTIRLSEPARKETK